MSIELKRDPFEPACIVVEKDGEWQGDIEQLADGRWIGDITQGIFAPSEPYKTQAEAVMYVTGGWRYL